MAKSTFLQYGEPFIGPLRYMRRGVHIQRVMLVMVEMIARVGEVIHVYH